MIDGNVDRFDGQTIEGWVVMRALPGYRLEFQVLKGNAVIGEFAAAAFRQDLADADIGDGNCAFRFEVPSHLSQSDLRKLQFRLKGSDFYWQPQR